MIKAIEGMPDGPIKEYFIEYWGGSSEIDEIIYDFEQKDYKFDKKAGMMFRPNKVAEAALKQTCLDIVFLRPSDMHYHKDVVEMIKHKGGVGEIHKFSPTLDIRQEDDLCGPGYESALLYPGGKSNEHGIETYRVHGFKPHKNPGYLEIGLVCSGMLDDKQEVCVKRFDKW